ncbi:hypothetical protein [Aeromicrobium fastidiosum]|uniref:Head-tail adaptor protein n=1 Tax=Aeromicrobium fastidiosum TaxID=52699 RepID=A0A641AJX6_9ACTN|nr:hypothetical protein [Aeromicrobium fastidiosum]KAA1376115.1 hypothetical protein ESP62_011765 [Aeromicrobium fastidiosum]MBP2392006.1 hypothetical protein [Aeromicrobium fastidiosum]
MAIFSALQHRATVSRSFRSFSDGRASFEWAEVSTDLPCLLDAHKPDEGQPVEFERADRKGQLLTGPRADILPGDRITMTRGAVGTYVVQPDPDERSTFHGLSHREFLVKQER